MKNKREKGNWFARQMIVYAAAGATVIAAVLFAVRVSCDAAFREHWSYLETQGFTFLELLMTQISVTFIVVSLVTVFSQRSITIYWEDVMQYKLVKPAATNFNALTAYLFTDLLASVILISARSCYCYITFLISIAVMVFLSLRMMEACFSGDLIRKELEKTFLEEKEKRSGSTAMRRLYQEHKMKTIQNTLQAIESNDIDVVCDNMKFLFRADEQEDGIYLLKKMAAEGRIYMLSRVIKKCGEQILAASWDNLQLLDGIARETILSCDELDASQYTVSIYKSLCEAVSDEDSTLSGNRWEVFSCTEEFIGFCRSNGKRNIADAVEEDLKKFKMIDGRPASS